MIAESRLTTAIARAIPCALATYAVARWFDGRFGELGDGLAWDIGHWAFLAAFLMFGHIVIAANGTIVRRGFVRTGRLAGAVGLVGVGLFLWVILGDLYPGVEEIYELPDPLMNLGPLAFLVGLVTPLAILTTSRPRVVPVVAPLAAVMAFVLLAVNLDFLIVAAILFGIGLWRLVPAGDSTDLAHHERSESSWNR